MVIYRSSYGFGRAGDVVAVLDPCSNYQACTSDREVYARWSWRDVCGNTASGPFEWRCSDGQASLVAPTQPGVYIVDVEYHKTVLNQDVIVGYDRMVVPVDNDVVDVHVDECRQCRLFFVDKQTGLVNALKLGDVRDSTVALPGDRFDGVAVGEGTLVTSKGVVHADAIRVKKEIVFNSAEDMSRWVAFKASMVVPEARVWLCSLGIDELPEDVAKSLLFLAMDDPILLTGAVVDVGVEDNKVYYEVVATLGQLHGILAILSDVAFGCVAGAAAAAWLAGVGAVAGCAVGAAVGFVVGYVFHAEDLVSERVTEIYNTGVANIDKAYREAVEALERLRTEGKVSEEAYRVIKGKTDELRRAALESLRRLRDAVEYVPTEEKVKYALIGGAAGFILGSLRR